MTNKIEKLPTIGEKYIRKSPIKCSVLNAIEIEGFCFDDDAVWITHSNGTLTVLHLFAEYQNVDGKKYKSKSTGLVVEIGYFEGRKVYLTRGTWLYLDEFFDDFVEISEIDFWKEKKDEVQVAVKELVEALDKNPTFKFDSWTVGLDELCNLKKKAQKLLDALDIRTKLNS